MQKSEDAVRGKLGQKGSSLRVVPFRPEADQAAQEEQDNAVEVMLEDTLERLDELPGELKPRHGIFISTDEDFTEISMGTTDMSIAEILGMLELAKAVVFSA